MQPTIIRIKRKRADEPLDALGIFMFIYTREKLLTDDLFMNKWLNPKHEEKNLEARLLDSFNLLRQWKRRNFGTILI